MSYIKGEITDEKESRKNFYSIYYDSNYRTGNRYGCKCSRNRFNPDSVAVVEVATPDSSALESGADSTSVQPIADVIYKKWRRGSHGQLQYRRWNDTKQEWVDDEWIDYKG